MKNKKTPVSLRLSTVLVEKCKIVYNTESPSDAIRNALADFLLLPLKEQEISDFALHQVIQNAQERKHVQSYSTRIPQLLFDIILSFSENASVSDVVTMILSRVLYLASQSTPNNPSNGSLLYVLGNKRNEKMQEAIKNIKETAQNVSWDTSVEPCAGGLGIFSNIKFANNEILNDADWLKVNLYRAVQENPRELIIRARVLSVTQATFNKQAKILKNTKLSKKINYEAAAAYLYLNKNSYQNKGERFDYTASADRYHKTLSAIAPLHQRLTRCTESSDTKPVLLNMDIFKVIEKYRKQKNVLFIVDPPYLDADVYNINGKEFGKDEHKHLAKLLRLVKQNNGNNFIYFCRITAPHRYQKQENADVFNIHMEGCIDDLYCGCGFYKIDVVLDENTTERIITSFKFDGAKPYGCEQKQIAEAEVVS